MSHAKQIANLEDARDFMTAGNATFTLRNPESGNRFTYKVRGGGDKPLFVMVLTGPDNDADFRYLGCIFDDGRFVVTRKSSISPKAPSALAFAWTWARVSTGRDIGPAEFWHEGRCGRCNRKLTVPESIDRGLGPDCAEKQAAQAA